MCPSHGGAAAQVRRGAAERVLERQAAAALERLYQGAPQSMRLTALDLAALAGRWTTENTPWSTPPGPQGHGAPGSDSRRTQPDPAVGALLRAARQRRGLGLKPLAARIDASPSYLSMLERGERSPSAAVAALLVDALGLVGAEAGRVLGAGVPGVGRDRVRTLAVMR